MNTSAVRGNEWEGKTIKGMWDSMGVVHILKTHHSKAPNAMHLIRCLSLIECTYNFTLVSKHLTGKHNTLADALSRNDLAHFLSYHPQAYPEPTPIPTPPFEILIIIAKTGLDFESLDQSV